MAVDPLAALFQPVLEAAWTDLEYIAAGQLGLPTTDWSTFSPERNILVINARMLEALGVASIERWRGMFLNFAAGEALSILAEETYLSPRLPATFATCVGDFFNNTLVTYTVSAGDYVTVKKSTTDDIRYIIDGPLSIPPGLTSGVQVRADTAGSIGSAIVGEIDEIEGSALPDVTFVNTSAATGRDVESDGDLAARARLGITALSIGGPPDAYEYFAKGGERNGEIDATIAAIGVTRVSVVEDLASGKVTCYFATISGGVSGTATTGDLGLINAKLLLRVVPSGVDYEGFSATPLVIDMDYTAYVPDSIGVDEDELKDAILAKFDAYIQSTRIGGPPEITPTPGFTGSITVSKTRGIITDVEVRESFPVTDAVHTINGGTEQLVQVDEVPVPGTVTASVVFQPPQEP